MLLLNQKFLLMSQANKLNFNHRNMLELILRVKCAVYFFGAG
jgi:hypothetical protein